MGVLEIVVVWVPDDCSPCKVSIVRSVRGELYSLVPLPLEVLVFILSEPSSLTSPVSLPSSFLGHQEVKPCHTPSPIALIKLGKLATNVDTRGVTIFSINSLLPSPYHSRIGLINPTGPSVLQISYTSEKNLPIGDWATAVLLPNSSPLIPPMRIPSSFLVPTNQGPTVSFIKGQTTCLNNSDP